MKKTILLLMFLFSVLAETANALIILTPEGKKYVTNQYLYIVGRIANDQASHISVSINDLKSPHIKIKDPEYVAQFKDFFIIDTELDEGENLIGITVYNDGKVIEDKKLTVFYAKKPALPPKNATPFYFHRTELEKNCLECHKMGKENCLDCHRRIISKKYVHGPAGTGDCEVCHDFTGKKTNKYSVEMNNSADICKNCHETIDPEKFTFVHGPVATGNCEVCHDLHSSEYPHQLINETNDMCISCHSDFKKDKSHVVVKHPVSGKKDPARPGKPFGCTSCHNPHGERSQFLFVKGIGSKMELCQICHRK